MWFMISVAIVLGPLLIILAILAILADTGGRQVALAAGSFLALTWAAPLVVDGLVRDGLDTFKDEILLQYGVLAVVAILVAVIAIRGFVRRDPLGKLLGKEPS